MNTSSKIRSIQWFLPVLLAVFGLLIVFAHGAFEFTNKKAELEDNIVRDIRSLMIRLQANLADNLNHGNKDAAQREVANQGVNSFINKLILLDEQEKVLLSMNYSDLGQLVSEISPSYTPPSQNSRLGFLLHKDNHIIQAYFPVQVNVPSGGLRNLENNWLYMEFNAVYQYQDLIRKIKIDLLILAMGVLLTTFFTWLILRTMIIRPLIEQGNVAHKIGMGDLEVRVPYFWFTELALLGKSMNKMVANVQIANENHVQDAKTSEQLIQQLEDKNTELERFTYTVSHDLKSPLVTVKGFVGLLKQDIKDNNAERINTDLNHIASAADQMAMLLEDLLELSRIGRVVNSPTEVLLSELFEEVLTVMHGQIEESKAIIDIQANMPAVFADKYRMLEVAQNLLDNAMKFRIEDTVPEIFVTATISGKNVVCCVVDNGIGIKQEYHNRIFGLFNRLNSSFDGTGIGLALVKRIIEVHNGKINVESKGEGQGTKFYITLPIYRATKL